VHLDRVPSEVERHIAGVQVVIGEELLDDVALVPQADHELVDPMRRVDLHDVPENRPPADLDHRLGPRLGLFTDAGSKPSGEDDCFHDGGTLAKFDTATFRLYAR
jgi:hypothetical protein